MMEVVGSHQIYCIKLTPRKGGRQVGENLKELNGKWQGEKPFK